MGLHPTRWLMRGRLFRVGDDVPDELMAGTLNALVDLAASMPNRWDPYLIVMDDGRRVEWREIAALAGDPGRPVVGRE